MQQSWRNMYVVTSHFTPHWIAYTHTHTHTHNKINTQVHIDTTRTDINRNVSASRDGVIPHVPPRCVRTTVHIPSLVRARTNNKSTARTASVSMVTRVRPAINTRDVVISDVIVMKMRTVSRRPLAFKPRTRVPFWTS